MFIHHFKWPLIPHEMGLWLAYAMHIEDEPNYHSNFNMVTFNFFIKKWKSLELKYYDWY